MIDGTDDRAEREAFAARDRLVAHAEGDARLAADRRAQAHKLLVHLTRRLDPEEPREVKVWATAAALRQNKTTVRRSLRRLERLGYLRLHDRTTAGVGRYTIARIVNGAITSPLFPSDVVPEDQSAA